MPCALILQCDRVLVRLDHIIFQPAVSVHIPADSVGVFPETMTILCSVRTPGKTPLISFPLKFHPLVV